MKQGTMDNMKQDTQRSVPQLPIRNSTEMVRSNVT